MTLKFDNDEYRALVAVEVHNELNLPKLKERLRELNAERRLLEAQINAAEEGINTYRRPSNEYLIAYGERMYEEVKKEFSEPPAPETALPLKKGRVRRVTLGTISEASTANADGLEDDLE